MWLAMTLLLAADPTALAKAHFQKGDVAYELGRFDEALREFTAAYEAKRLPAFLFNIGQCHRELKQWEQAIFFYRGYLHALPEAPNRALVDELIADAERALAKHDERASAPRVIVIAPAALPASLPFSPPRPVYKQAWFWGTIGGGVATVTAAIVLSVVLTLPPPPLPSGTLGTVDRRGGR
jgi:tetratricopeptide (TPR) repeat protein